MQALLGEVALGVPGEHNVRNALAALAVLTIHLAASLASALPPAAPLPRATVRRWVQRALTVLGLSLPVWALLVAQSANAPKGVPLMTYAAVAAVAILALSFWLTQSRTATQGPHVRQPTQESQRPRR